jgi:glycosyltransferase involved in cell wall biosynthesis
MRLAFLTHEPFYPPSGGGSAEAIYLVEELVRRGHEVHLFCPKLEEGNRVAKKFGVHFHEFTAWQMSRYTSLRNFKYLAYPFFLQRLVERASRTVRFDLVLSQHAISAMAAGRLKKKLRAAVVMNFLDYLTGFLETWPRYLAPRRVIRTLERFELSMPTRYAADGVMTVSDTLADHFANAGYPRERILPIYYGYDAALFPESTNAKTDEPPVIVMHGSFDQHHLGNIALEAIRRVVGTRPDVTFRFVGKQTAVLTKFCRRVRAAAAGARLDCLGFVPYTEIAPRLASASVGIVPYEESTGTHCAFVGKIVEYLGVGLPVVSTPLKSAQRYFGNEPAVRFSGFDGEDFGKLILSWLDETPARRQELGRKASRRVRAELDWRVISRNGIDFVEKIHRQPGKN